MTNTTITTIIGQVQTNLIIMHAHKQALFYIYTLNHQIIIA